MTTREAWDELVRELRDVAYPRSHPALSRLHWLALTEGKAALKGFHQLDQGLREDVICDFLVAELEPLLRAERPRSYFIVAVRRRAIDLLRRRKRERPRGAEDDTTDDASEFAAGIGGDPGFVLDARRSLEGLSERDLRIVTAMGLGEDREALAASYGISRAAIDQIVSRVRKRFAGEAR